MGGVRAQREPLWAKIRLNAGDFMLGCSGRAPSRAPRRAMPSSSNATATTTTQADIDNGIVNIVIGFAPLKPAEFVVINIRQIAGSACS